MNGISAALHAVLQNLFSVNRRGTFSFDETAIVAQPIVTIEGNYKKWINSIWLDMTNVTQDCTLTIFHKIDGTNQKSVSTHDFTVATDLDGWLIVGGTFWGEFEIALECGGGGAGSVDIPYRVV